MTLRQSIEIDHFIEFSDTSNVNKRLRVKVSCLSSSESFCELHLNESFEKMLKWNKRINGGHAYGKYFSHKL